MGCGLASILGPGFGNGPYNGKIMINDLTSIESGTQPKRSRFIRSSTGIPRPCDGSQTPSLFHKNALPQRVGQTCGRSDGSCPICRMHLENSSPAIEPTFLVSQLVTTTMGD